MIFFSKIKHFIFKMITLFKNLFYPNQNIEIVNTYLQKHNLYEHCQVEYTTNCIFIILTGGVYNDTEIHEELSNLITDLDIYIILKDILNHKK